MPHCWTKRLASYKVRVMRDPNPLDSLTQEVFRRLPQGFSALGEDLRKQFRTALAGALSKLDLVTREEFDVQTAVLQRTREKLSELEAVVDSLEQQLRPGSGSGEPPP